ncbi:MAG: linear amide C-N hydrolase [Clostridiaceae bacterium]
MCTSIKVDYDGGSVMGRNMDWDMDIDYSVLYYPVGCEYSQDLYNNPLVNKYKMLGVCFRNMNPLKDGVNEHGLMGSTNMFYAMNLFSGKVEPGKINLDSLNYFNYCLANYKTCQELVADLPNIHISKKDYLGNKAITPDFHYYFVDALGDSVVIEPTNKKLTAYENKYKVMTNSPPLDHHARKLEETIAPKNGRRFHPAKDLPGGYDPVSRFIKAYYLNENIANAVTRADALENTYSILEALKIPEAFTKTKFDYTYTKYMTAYDSQSRLLTIRSHMNPRIYSLSIDDVAHLTSRTQFLIPQDIQLEPLSTGSAKPQ